MNLKTNKKGFLLIEVITSVLIMSVALVFIIRSFSSSLKVIKTSNEYFRASLFLDEIMWPYNDKGIFPGNFNGTLLSDEKYKWDVISSEFDSESPSDYKINKVVSKILWKSANFEANLLIATLLKDKEI